MPHGAIRPVCVRTRSLARRMHDLPPAARFGEPADVGLAQSDPLPEVPFPTTNLAGAHLHRRARSHAISLPWNLLERRLPRGGAWLANRVLDAILNVAARERPHEDNPQSMAPARDKSAGLV